MFDLDTPIDGYFDFDCIDDTYHKHITEQDIEARALLCQELIALFDFIHDLGVRREKIQERVLLAAYEKKIFKADAYRIIDGLNNPDYYSPSSFARYLVDTLFGMYLPINKRGDIKNMTFRDILENQEF